MVKCNSTLTDELIQEKPLWHGYTFHKFGLALAGSFGLVALCIGLSMIYLHASHYLKPYEQRHIIRILLLIPIYSTVSFLSYVFYWHAIYFDILEGCYEAFAISSFFTLLCHYIAPNLHEQKEYFRRTKPKNWFWGVFGLQYITGGETKGPFRKPRSGLTWFNVIWIGVFQYCFIRVFFSIVAVIAQINDVYCQESLSPAFAHVWVQVFEAASVTVAMFCLIQFYIQLKDDLSEYRPFLKVLCIKLVIFFSFWQSIIISFLSGAHGPLQPTKYLDYPDINVGIPSTLLCIEMAIFAVMHIFAFPWKPYSLKHSYNDPLNEPGGGISGVPKGYAHGLIGALADAFNPWDIVKMTARGFRWLFVGARKREQDISYQQHHSTKLGEPPGYVGPVYAGSGEAATELGRRSDAVGAEDDRAGLLASGQQRMAPYRTYSDEAFNSTYDSQVDLGARDRGHEAGPNPLDFDMKSSEFANDSEEDTGYHPHMGPTAGAGRADAGGAVHPALRSQGSAGWPLSQDADSIRAATPSYRSR